ncbi:MAG: hypothetical protein M1834_008898 [Cirrosporium novae-zelandiae]|nr:MAG: hypothetical protein M1834_008898 [Cirrosporium novae-zelandiae]
MLPKFLYGSYKRYKSDTDRFTTWLVKAAQTCGYQKEFSQPTTNLGGGKKSKKKNKKKKENNEDNPSPIKYRISLAEFTSLAKQIATSGKAVQVPLAIIGIAQRAIGARKRCANWFSKHVTNNDEGHQYFITVFEEVLEILSPLSNKELDKLRADSSPKVDNNPTLEELANKFSLLETEELETDVDMTSNSQMTSKKEPQTQTFEVDEGEGNNEKEIDILSILFEVYCLFEDMHNIREFIQQIWADYKSGNTDLMSASITTNTACDLVRQITEECLASYPQYTEWIDLSQSLFATACYLRGEDPSYRERADDIYNIAAADVAEWSYVPMYQFLEALCRVLEPGCIPLYKPGHFGRYDPLQDRSKMSPAKKLEEDKIILLEIFPEFAILEQFDMNMPSQDEFTRGMRRMVKTREIPLWLAFATQVHLDIHHVLRENVSKGFQELRLAGLRTRKILDDHFQLSRSLPYPGTWPKRNDRGLEQIKEMIDFWITRDNLYEVKKHAAPVQSMDHQEFSFYERHPLVCGLLMFNVNLKMQEAGITFVNAWGTVVYLIYLLNAVQQTGVVTLNWPDMEKLIQFHGEERIFFGAKPKTVEDSYKKACLTMGVAPGAISFRGGTKRPDSLNHIISKSGPRGLKDTSIVSEVFKSRYCNNGSIDISVYNIEKLLNELTNADATTKAHRPRTGELLLQRQWEKSHKMSSLQLLAALRERLEDEENRLIFNYFGLHRRCIELLRSLRTELHDKLVQYNGPQYIENESQLPCIPLYVLLAAMNSGKAALQMGIKSVMTHSLMLTRSGNLMKEFLEKKGDVGCKELRAFCKRKEELEVQQQKEEDSPLYMFTLEELVDPTVMAYLTTFPGPLPKIR